MSDGFFRWRTVLDLLSWLVLLLAVVATSWRTYGLLDVRTGGLGGVWAIEFGSALLDFALALLLFLALRLLLLGVAALANLRDLSTETSAIEVEETAEQPADGV